MMLLMDVCSSFRQPQCNDIRGFPRIRLDFVRNESLGFDPRDSLALVTILSLFKFIFALA
jgi:hypothetical protein